jgi:hypothetical protein
MPSTCANSLNSAVDSFAELSPMTWPFGSSIADKLALELLMPHFGAGEPS